MPFSVFLFSAHCDRYRRYKIIMQFSYYIICTLFSVPFSFLFVYFFLSFWIHDIRYTEYTDTCFMVSKKHLIYRLIQLMRLLSQFCLQYTFAKEKICKRLVFYLTEAIIISPSIIFKKFIFVKITMQKLTK